MHVRSCSILVLLFLCGFAASVQADDLTPIAPSDVRWAGGDPPKGAAAASAGAAEWPAGASAHATLRRSPVLWASVPLPTGDWRAPTLLLEGVSGGVELWIDGERRWTLADENMTSVLAVPVPVTALGRHVELRLNARTFPAALTHIAIGEQAQAAEVIVRRGLGALLGAFIMFAVGLAALASWIVARRDPFLLRVFVFCLSAGALAFGLGSGTAVFVGEPARQFALILGTSLFPWSALALVRAGFPKHAPRWSIWLERVSLGWCALSFVGLAFSASRFIPALAPVVFLAAISVGVFVVLRAARSGDDDGRLLMGGFFVFLAVIVYDTLSVVGLRDPSGFHTHWALLTMTAAFVGIFARRTFESDKALREQTQRLAAREQEERAVTTRLFVDASELLVAVSQLRESGLSQNEVIEKQAAALQETQVTAEEIRRTSTLASEKAQVLLEQAVIAEETQRAGEQAVEDSLEGMNAIGSQVATMAAAMTAVDTLAQEIGSIVGVVKELADQSNMLALNAAIEAVRSGEHGKGFAVVAREVRRLADQSLAATARIREALERLGDGVRESAVAGERGERSIATALGRLRGSGEQMRAMSSILRDTNASVRQISAAVTQQNAGISQIFTAVQHLSEQMRQAVQRMQEAEAATGAIEIVADRMSQSSGFA